MDNYVKETARITGLSAEVVLDTHYKLLQQDDSQFEFITSIAMFAAIISKNS